jgi:thiamine pyrophosphate-dependent acetolactate synthase large subunit-like protein
VCPPLIAAIAKQILTALENSAGPEKDDEEKKETAKEEEEEEEEEEEPRRPAEALRLLHGVTPPTLAVVSTPVLLLLN